MAYNTTLYAAPPLTWSDVATGTFIMPAAEAFEFGFDCYSGRRYNGAAQSDESLALIEEAYRTPQAIIQKTRAMLR